MNTYYFVSVYYNDFPMIFTCAEKDGKFYKIDEKYFEDGQVGEELKTFSYYVLVDNKDSWKDLILKL